MWSLEGWQFDVDRKNPTKIGVNDRKIWMYDTYEGMSEPGEEDKDVGGGCGA